MNISRKNVFVLATIAVLLVSILLVFLSFRQKFLFQKSFNLIQKNQITTEISPNDTQEKYCVYAKKTLDWLDKNRDKNGKYFYEVGCDISQKQCKDYVESGQSGHDAMTMIWARYKYFLKTGEEDQINIIKKDIDIYFKQLDEMKIQNDFWNCKFLTEMYEDKYLGEEYLIKIKKLCDSSIYQTTNNIYERLNENHTYEIIANDVPYLEKKNINDTLLSQVKEKYNIDEIYGPDCTYYPSDLVARYRKNGNEVDLKSANSYFNELLVQYYLNQNQFAPRYQCTMAISSLDLYLTNKNTRYLNWSKQIYQTYFNNHQIQPEAKVPECAFLNRELSKIDNSLEYDSYNFQFLDYFINNYWDGENGANVSNEEGFFETDNNRSKVLRENALIVNLLCP